MSHFSGVDRKLHDVLAAIDDDCAARVRLKGCPHCGGPLDRADYDRKARGELGDAAELYSRRSSFCCRVDGCRKRATPPSLRFFGRRIYVAVWVIVASVVGRAQGVGGHGRLRRVEGVPARTVSRWLAWWETVFAVGRFFLEAKAFFAVPIEAAALPASLLERFGTGAAALERMLRFVSPVTTTSMNIRIAMVA